MDLFNVNENNDEVDFDDDYNDENENNINNNPNEDIKNKIINENEEQDILAKSSSTNYSLMNSKNLSEINNNYNIDNNYNNKEHTIIFPINEEKIQNIELKEEKNNINENIFNEPNEEKEKIIYNNILKLIIDNNQNKIINSIIISENNTFINYITNAVIHFNLLQNKKICFLVSDTKKAKNIYDLYKTNANIKSILLQKGTNRKNKNDLKSFSDQLNSNNLFIILPNILYKLLSIGFVQLSNFGLIIFDECHLCDANHPYNIIMQEFYFFYLKFPSNKVNSLTLPKIIGLTQSPFKEKGNIKNEKKGNEILKNIAENLDCQYVLDPDLFNENLNLKNSFNENIDIIGVKSIFEEKNKINGINILLMKYFFEPMLDFCLEDYLNIKGDSKELNNLNIKEIRNIYISSLKEKFSKENFEEYNNIETAERRIHFLSQNSNLFKTFEDIQKMLINIIQNFDLNEIYYLFEKYIELYENNLKKLENPDIYLIKFYKTLINIFKINIKVFGCLINKKIQYRTDRLNKFIQKIQNIYAAEKEKNKKTLICVSNRKMVYILYNYLNRDSFYKNKIGFIVGTNNKKEENTSLTISIRSSTNDINERKKEYNENKINILICTTPGLDYLKNEKCDYILIFSEMLNVNNDFEKIKEKAKNTGAKLIIFLHEKKVDYFNTNFLLKKNNNNINNSNTDMQLKKYFLDKDKNIKSNKDFRSKNYIEKKNLEKYLRYYIKNTEAKMTLKNCTLLFNEIYNLFFSKNIKININKNIVENFEDPKYICQCEFHWNNQKQLFISNRYYDKQSAENECYLRFLMYLHKTGEIDDNFRIKM